MFFWCDSEKNYFGTLEVPTEKDLNHLESFLHARWAPTSCKEGYNSVYGAYNPSYRYITPFAGIIRAIYN